MIFERRTVDVVPTPVGERIIRQARTVLSEAEHILEIAQVDRDPLNGPLKLGVIYTVSPYLLPELVRRSVARTPQMPLLLTEDYTVNLLQKLKNGQIDAAILAMPAGETGLMECDLYDEDFVVVVPKHHRLAKEKIITPAALASENMLILAQGNCFRDQVLEVCPETMRVGNANGLTHQLEGSSLATIRHMVASGLGVSVFPASARNYDVGDSLVTYIDFADPVPTRRIGIVWRKSFPRTEAIMAVVKACQSIRLEGITHLPAKPHLTEDPAPQSA
jgi:LysR family hydrogen peroxide-inducible transcriptional activator